MFSFMEKANASNSELSTIKTNAEQTKSQTSEFLDPAHWRETAPKNTANNIDVAALKKAVENVGPRVYRLVGHKGEKLRFFVIGCQGTGEPAQKEVAELMNKIALESKDHPPAFILFLGDNMYDYGVTSPTDEL